MFAEPLEGRDEGLLEAIPGAAWVGDARPARALANTLSEGGDLPAVIAKDPSLVVRLYREVVPRAWNSAAAERYGLPRAHPADALVGVPHDQLHELAGMLLDALSGGRRGEARVRLVDASGRHLASRFSWACIGPGDDPLAEVVQVVISEDEWAAEHAHMETRDEQLRGALMGSHTTAFALDADLRVDWALNSPVAIPDGGSATRITALVGPEAGQRIEALLAPVVASGADVEGLVEVSLDGEQRTFQLQAGPRRNATGAIDGVVGVVTDVTDRQLVADAALQLSGAGGWSYSIGDDEFTFTNAFYAAIGWSADDFGGYAVSPVDYVMKVVHPDEIDIVSAGIAAAVTSDDPNFQGRLKHRFFRADGSEGLLEVTYVTERDENGAVIALRGVNRDVTEAESQAALNATLSRRLESAVHAADIGVWEVTLPGGATLSNEQTRAHRGYGTADAGEWSATLEFMLELVLPEDRQRVRRVIMDTATGGTFSTEYSIRARDGSTRIMFTRGSVDPAPGGFGAERVVTAMEIDVTEQRSAEIVIDPLTGLGNRRGLMRAIGELRGDTARRSWVSGLVALDIAGFQVINDVYGYEAGDALLKELADLLRREVPPGAVLTRIAGDKFAVLLPGSAEAQTIEVAGQIKEHIERAEFACVGDRFETQVTVAAGYTMVPPGADEAEVMGSLDIALRAAKRTRVGVAALDMTLAAHRESVATRLRWGARVRRALDEGGLELMAQPIVDLTSLEAHSFELLIRLREGERVIAAGEFMPAVTALGMSPLIDRWVLNEALRWAAHEADWLGLRRIAINLTPRTLAEPWLVGMIDDLASQHGTDLGCLTVEMVETELRDDTAQLRKNVADLRERGARLAIDDFGAGASSFEYLKTLEVDMLKLDGRFVVGARTSLVDRAFVSGAVAMAAAFGIPLVAEWIEDGALAREMAELGVDLAQGFYFGRPTPLVELVGAG